jgi:hypothetical protein
MFCSFSDEFWLCLISCSLTLQHIGHKQCFLNPRWFHCGYGEGACNLDTDSKSMLCRGITKSVADPDPGSGAFLTTGSAIRDG